MLVWNTRAISRIWVPHYPRLRFGLVLVALAATIGCRSPDYADGGGLLGGLTGGGGGALVGEATGHAGAGAAIGAAAGALPGAGVGDHIDADVARSQAEIQAR